MTTTLIDLPVGGSLATFQRAGSGRSTLVFLPGYQSDMLGAKALALDRLAERTGTAMLRLDYSGTGDSPGEFHDGTLERWIGDALFAIDSCTKGPLILCGSSMGGWIALHLALRRPDRVAALVGIAAAPDFTEWGFSDTDKAVLRRDGVLSKPNDYGPEPMNTFLPFWESGQKLCLLDGPIDFAGPVRLIHGDADPDVPVDVALRLMAALRSDDVQLTLVKGGRHRLSAPHELRAITDCVESLLELS